jgi:phage terminase large subunit-like protein
MPLTQAEEVELLKLFAEEELYRARNRLLTYKPYPKQLEFHDAGARHRERLLMASNRFGKTVSGAAETAIHLTGRYPDWWTGKRFTHPVRAWASGVTNESTRDVVQEKLMGPPERRGEWGTGMIPHDALDLNEISTGRGLADQIDTVPVKHASGGWSRVQFKSYERGREKWQGTAQELIWMDEEPPMDVYLEALTRTNETGGVVMVTFTPLLGYSGVVMRFLGGDEDDQIAA